MKTGTARFPQIDQHMRGNRPAQSSRALVGGRPHTPHYENYRKRHPVSVRGGEESPKKRVVKGEEGRAVQVARPPWPMACRIQHKSPPIPLFKPRIDHGEEQPRYEDNGLR